MACFASSFVVVAGWIASILAISAFLAASTSAFECAPSIAVSAVVFSVWTCCLAASFSSVVEPLLALIAVSWACTLSAIACFAAGLTFASGVIAAIVASFVVFALSTSAFAAALSISAFAVTTAWSTLSFAACCSSVVESFIASIAVLRSLAFWAISALASDFLVVAACTWLIAAIPLSLAVATSLFEFAVSRFVLASCFLVSNSVYAACFSSVVEALLFWISCLRVLYAFSTSVSAAGLTFACVWIALILSNTFDFVSATSCFDLTTWMSCKPCFWAASTAASASATSSFVAFETVAFWAFLAVAACLTSL